MRGLHLRGGLAALSDRNPNWPAATCPVPGEGANRGMSKHHTFGCALQSVFDGCLVLGFVRRKERRVPLCSTTSLEGGCTGPCDLHTVAGEPRSLSINYLEWKREGINYVLVQMILSYASIISKKKKKKKDKTDCYIPGGRRSSIHCLPEVEPDCPSSIRPIARGIAPATLVLCGHSCVL